MPLSPGVHDRVSLMPALHLPVVELQIGQVWMNVLQVLLGQSASVMQPRLALAPATQAPVSQVPERVQSPSLQHGVFGASGARQRPVSLTHVPPPPHASVVPQPPPPVQFAPGVVPPEHRIGIRSPVRKMPELSGRFRFVTLPALQSALPVAFAVIVLERTCSSEAARYWGSVAAGRRDSPCSCTWSVHTWHCCRLRPCTTSRPASSPPWLRTSRRSRRW